MINDERDIELGEREFQRGKSINSVISFFNRVVWKWIPFL